MRVVLPQPLAGLGIEGIDLAPGRGHIDSAIDHQRRGLVAAAALGQIPVPGEPQLTDIARIDLRERTEALLAVIAAIGKPLARILRQVGRVAATGA